MCIVSLLTAYQPTKRACGIGQYLAYLATAASRKRQSPTAAGVCSCCLCLLGACLVFAHRYAKPGSNEWVTRTAVDATTGDHLFYFGCFAVACAALICLMVRNKLVVEDLTWRDII